ncbi:PfaD family polyunsaturated fatty acid/polyketide biosynthesis protein [Nocardia tengchongensis]|uniref:PfaD family polyunsaturated fatty acid/polyketide biosynthesis protein n=1 Tax=Nocardia tengchongensis TaxID=2055889 RepID=UPI0036C3F01B
MSSTIDGGWTPESFGDPGFREAHGVRYAYVAGEMAHGIATTRMVIAMAEAGMMGFFGAGGLPIAEIRSAIVELGERLAGRSNWGVNLLHSPAAPGHEDAVVDLVGEFRVPCLSASAFMELTPAVVRAAVSGLHTDHHGRIARRTNLFAKVSRVEPAAMFMSPAPPELLSRLVAEGRITETEARLAARVPLATDVTVEADSGGHTDNRPLTVALPQILALRDRLHRSFGYEEPIRVGAGGGLGDPRAIAAAFACGADYVVTGTINQTAVEAGLSDRAKAMLSQAGMTDVVMAPSADMFEYGVKVQVLRRGTMFAGRAGLLYRAYQEHAGLDDLPADVRTRIERDLFRCDVDQVWRETAEYWAVRDPEQLARAEADPKHRMALVFRSYLGRSTRWAIAGDPDRNADYQVWCGPAIGSFNRWIADTELADPARRSVVAIAHGLLHGAADTVRSQRRRVLGIPAATVA